MLHNYLITTNPWHLTSPPLWWLQKLADHDRDLVVFPSQHRMAYVLARRRHHSNAMTEMHQLDQQLLKESAGLDGDILATHNLIYVRHLIGNTIRRYEIFQWLRDHDGWAMGGADKTIAVIETEEQFQAEKTRAQTLADIDYRAQDAWRSYQARTGRRVGYGTRQKYRMPAQQMPLTSFTPAESAVAGFYGR